MIIKMFSSHRYATKARSNSLACETAKEFCLACVEDVMYEAYMEGKKEGRRVEKYKTGKNMLERKYNTPAKKKKFEKGYRKFCKEVEALLKKEQEEKQKHMIIEPDGPRVEDQIITPDPRRNKYG